MQIDIRKNVLDNFNNTSTNDIKESIEEAIKEHDEITLPGLGVFFEILWNFSDNEFKNAILNILESGMKKGRIT